MIDELLSNPQEIEPGNSFVGMDIGLDGVPVDIARLHILSQLIPDYKLLIADSFAHVDISGTDGLNGTDMEYAREQYMKVFRTLDSIFDHSSSAVFSSDFFSDPRYDGFRDEISSGLDELGVRDQLSTVNTEHGKVPHERFNYALNEIALTLFMAEFHGYNTKFGPPTESKYDDIIKKLDPSLSFVYLFPSRSLSGDVSDVSPHRVESVASMIELRLLMTDDPDTIEDKLSVSELPVASYFAQLGSFAGRSLGKAVLNSDEISSLGDDEVRALASEYLIDNLIAPFRRSEGIPIHKKSPMRRLYDFSVDEMKATYDGFVPGLLDVARPKLDSISSQLFYLLGERKKYSQDLSSGVSPESLRTAGIDASICDSVYVPILGIMETGGHDSGDSPAGLDLQIMKLLQERILVGYNVVLSKIGIGKSIYDGVREQKVVNDAAKKGLNYGLEETESKTIVQYIIERTKQLEETVISRYALDFNQ